MSDRRSAILAPVVLGLAMVTWAPSPGLGQDTPPATPAAAGSGAAEGNAQPIEIVSDDLVVEQDRRIATFRGHVDAVQGDVRLRADKLEVFYNDSQQQAAAGGQQVRLLEAYGNVMLLQKGDTAEGDHGTYLVAERKVTLDGAVVLTRGGNVVRGARLESDLATGVSRVLAAEGGAGQRVRAVFAPQPAAAGAPPAAKPAAGASRPAPRGGGS